VNDTSSRSPQEIFQHHGEVLIAGDLDGIVSDYSDDAVMISPDGVKRGKDGLREAFVKLLSDVPDAEWEVPTQHFVDDLLFIEWKATSKDSCIEDGIDKFAFRDGLIRAQTVRYTLSR
jgi:hypothetical protein